MCECVFRIWYQGIHDDSRMKSRRKFILVSKCFFFFPNLNKCLEINLFSFKTARWKSRKLEKISKKSIFFFFGGRRNWTFVANGLKFELKFVIAYCTYVRWFSFLARSICRSHKFEESVSSWKSNYIFLQNIIVIGQEKFGIKKMSRVSFKYASLDFYENLKTDPRLISI